jgi:DNA-dependent RNA polymerase auxiliary subunit epsilon
LFPRVNFEFTLRGEICEGDFEHLKKIHEMPVPITDIHISSAGGSVKEALKIAKYVYENHVRVETDYDFGTPNCRKSQLPEDGFCGCASACAIIWLAAPLRKGSHVIVHRPYFQGDRFSQLPDSVALKAYDQAAAEVRQLLEERGYSKEFITKVFSVPQERGERLTYDQISGFPSDTALDELTSARCYKGTEKELAEYAAGENEMKRLGDVRQRLANSDADQRKLADRMSTLKNRHEALWQVNRNFEICKEDERVAMIARKNGKLILMLPCVKK